MKKRGHLPLNSKSTIIFAFTSSSKMKAAVATTAVLVVILAAWYKVYLEPLYNEFVESDYHNRFFEGRVEYIHLLGLSRPAKLVLSYLPIIDPLVREHLRQDFDRGPRPTNTSNHVYYDPKIHDRSYRSLKTNFLSREECATIRGMLDRNVDQSPQDFGESPDSSLNKEFESVSMLKLLGLEDTGDSGDDEEDEVDITGDERQLLLSMLNRRLQSVVEETFNSTTIFLEYSSITRRRNPVQSKRTSVLGFMEHLQYLSSGGHGVHSDRCSFGPRGDEIFFDGFRCRQTTEHCCPHRTHSVLLYLNDPDDDQLKGGDFYMVDRNDLADDNNPSFSSNVGLAEHMRHTLRVKPHCGNLMLFTADTRNVHGTYPIVQGVRYAMPMWQSDMNMIDRDDNSLQEFLDRIWHHCPQMGGFDGLSIPSRFKTESYIDDNGYIIDCEELLGDIEAVIDKSTRRRWKEEGVEFLIPIKYMLEKKMLERDYLDRNGQDDEFDFKG